MHGGGCGYSLPSRHLPAVTGRCCSATVMCIMCSVVMIQLNSSGTCCAWRGKPNILWLLLCDSNACGVEQVVILRLCAGFCLTFRFVKGFRCSGDVVCCELDKSCRRCVHCCFSWSRCCPVPVNILALFCFALGRFACLLSQ